MMKLPQDTTRVRLGRPVALALLVWMLALGGGLAPAAADDNAITEEGPPNIVLILTDDQGWHDVGYYGTQDLKTPHIDRIAREGLRFDYGYANCPVCSPTRAAILSGHFPDLVGVPGVIRTHAENSWGYLSPTATLLPDRLQEAGYQTAIIGKWHLGLESPNTPLERGFQFFHGFLGDMMDDYYNHRRHGNNYMRRDREVITPEGHATDLFSDWAAEYIEAQAEESKPFFLFLTYNAPHTPIQPPDDWLEKVTEREPDITPARAKLVALIEHLDHGIGRVLDALDRTQQANNTLVVFVSDNGGQLNVGANNGPLRDGKGSMYEGGLRVPLAIRWPARVRPGVTEQVTLTMDLVPTLCEVAGVTPPRRIDGVSVLPALLGRPQEHDSERTLVWVRREGGQFEGQDWYALRRGDWKLVQASPFARPELYNLKDDPREQDNRRDKNAGVYRELTRLLRLHVQRAGQVPWQPRSAAR